MTTPRRLNCAVYVRKSTAEGLEQAFNSLDAQRAACAAYIESQKAEGWVMLPEHYDDGGYSGGTMDRPALQRLLQAVQSGQIDTIVVHRIDRLSRSLADFAKLVEIFDTHKVTFVSVTQSFNTTTSMGRLTLNILLSFAQFERELAGERVRDKIAASRQRGIWMGGMPPYGYDVVNRKLIPNPQEAAIVREMFTRFAAVPSMATLLRDLRARGVTSKSWTTREGKQRPGKLIDKGYIYRLFKSPLYIGIAAYKGNHYPGEHEPIIDRSLWDQVQQLIQTGNPRAKRNYAPRTVQAPSVLRGLLVSPEGRAFTPQWTKRGTKIYRYYVNTDAIKLGADTCEISRVPAGEVESVVIEQLRQILRSPEVLSHAVREVVTLRPDILETKAIAALQSIDQVWNELFPAEQARIIQAVIERITIRRSGISITWKTAGMTDLLRAAVEQHALRNAV